MSNSFEHSIERSSYRDARDNFSVDEIWKQVYEVSDDELFEGFTVGQLDEWAEFGCRELTRVQAKGMYSAEVFISLERGDEIYQVVDGEVSGAVVHEDQKTKVMYGYVRDFTVSRAPGYANKSLMAEVWCYEGNGDIETYIVPLVSEGSSNIIYLTEAPVPVMEGDVMMELGGVQREVFELDEQEMMRSLLNLVENDMFDRQPISMSQVNGTVMSFLREGFIEGLDDISAAVNHYLQRCAHEIDDEMWLVNLGTYVGKSLEDCIYLEDGSGCRGVMKPMSGEYALEGVEFFLSQEEGVQSRMYVTSEDGELFSIESRLDAEIRLYRQSYDGADELED